MQQRSSDLFSANAIRILIPEYILTVRLICSIYAQMIVSVV
jgi:hypothetical protein